MGWLQARKSPKQEQGLHGFTRSHAKLVEHYFSSKESLYNETDFERCFCMPKYVFNHIFEALVKEEVYPLVQTYCAVTKKPGIVATLITKQNQVTIQNVAKSTHTLVH